VTQYVIMRYMQEDSIKIDFKEIDCDHLDWIELDHYKFQY